MFLFGLAIGFILCIAVEAAVLWLIMTTEDEQHRKFNEQQQDYEDYE